MGVFHRSSQRIGERMADLLENLNDPRPHHSAVLARFGAEVSNESSASPTDPIKILDLCIDEGVQALRRRKRVVAKGPLDHRSDIPEIQIKELKAEGFFGNEVVGERSLRHSRSLNYVTDARARVAALVHDAKALSQ